MSAILDDYENSPVLEGEIIYEPDWYLLTISAETFDSLQNLLSSFDFPYKAATRPHISVMKNEAPCLNKEDWGTAFVGEKISFKYSPTVYDNNGLHLWLDCYSERLCRMREHFGLVTLKREDDVYLVNFHLTLARRKKAVEPHFRKRLRLCPQSHIDAETGMQHL